MSSNESQQNNSQENKMELKSVNPQLSLTLVSLLALLPVIISANGDANIEVALNVQDSSLSLRSALQKFASSSHDGLWLLVPANVSLADWQLNNADYNLFKLNTDQLAQASAESEPMSSDESQAEPRHWTAESHYDKDGSGARRARKMNFFKNVLNKPKVSPLYLINGTVCRFVNQQPICTTLSTTGLLRPNQSNSGQLQQGGLFGQNNNQQTQLTNNPQQGARQVGPPGQQPSGQPGIRPAAIMDDELTEINVESALLANSTNGTNRLGNNRPQQTANVQASRPVNFVVSRRPLNLLTFARPLRQYQFSSRRNINRN